MVTGLWRPYRVEVHIGTYQTTKYGQPSKWITLLTKFGVVEFMQSTTSLVALQQRNYQCWRGAMPMQCLQSHTLISAPK